MPQPANVDDPERWRGCLPLSISVAHDDGHLVLNVAGEIDLDTRDHFAEFVSAAMDQSGSVVIDLRDVTFLGSVALSVLVEAATRARSSGDRVAVCRPTPLVRKVLGVSGVDDLIDIRDDLPGDDIGPS